MRIQRLSIDGYGRFSGLKLSCTPGLQILLGPNERGKSTLRAFIGDMLYGQRSERDPDRFDEGHALRTPWENPDCYGGAIAYALDDGRIFEIVRNFDPKRAAVQILEHRNGTADSADITGAFGLLRNSEPDVGLQHLGLAKEVFLNTATITHLTLEDLGDGEALDQIREKLVALMDTGGEDVSSETALRWLEARIQAIGRPDMPGGPLPRCETRLETLYAERETLLSLHAGLAELAGERKGLQEERAQCRQERLELENDLRLIDAHERAARLREAESLTQRIQTATQHCFALASVRDFPMEQLPRVQAAEKAVEAARLQLERSRAESAEVQSQCEAERERIGGDESLREEIPAELEKRLAETGGQAGRLRERLAEAEAAETEAEAQARDAQERTEALPDFSRVAPDPVEWISQLASSFKVAVKTRDEEQEECNVLRGEIAERESALAPYRALFSRIDDFPAAAREYELRKRMMAEHESQGAQARQALQSEYEELGEELPGFRTLGGLTAVLAGGLAGGFLYTQVAVLLIPCGMLGLGAAWFFSHYAFTRSRMRRLQRQMDQMSAERERAFAEGASAAAAIETMLSDAKCESVRELEARFDAYRDFSAELTARAQVLETQLQRAEESEQRVSRMFERFKETFARVGEHIADEDGVAEAAARAITRYQDYREAKRQMADARDALEKARQESGGLREKLEELAGNGREAEEELRALMRRNGFPEEAEETDAMAAMRAYRDRLAAAREQRGRLALLRERRLNLERQVKREELELEKHEQDLAHLLARAGVASIDQWNAMADQAREYRDVWGKRAALQEQLDSLLRDSTIAALREAVAANGELPPSPRPPRAELKERLDAISARIDALVGEEHALQVTAAERRAGARALCEVEEEIALLELRRDRLRAERDAAAQAMALIEEIARDKHARIAPRLAKKASERLRAITGGVYSEITVARDLSIGVRIPQTGRIAAHPGKVLSKGTVDQVYLALRLALVETLSESGERLPMLLDDPFANYDDERLIATMRIIREMAGQHQVLLFTCREDVARAAEAVEAPIVRL